MAEEMTETVEQTRNEEGTSSPSTIGDLHPKMKIPAIVKQIELYGAFVDIGVGTNAILHISKMGNRVNRVSDVVALGDEIEVWVEKIDLEKGQVTVTLKLDGDKTALKAPSVEIFNRIVAMVRSILHLEEDNASMPLALGLRGGQVDIQVKVERGDSKESLRLKFPDLGE